MLLSFNPVIDGDRYIWALTPWDTELLSAIREAHTIVLPQTVSRELYRLCRENCPRVFPNYDLRFSWEGKIGDALLFWTFGAPHPKTIAFPRLECLLAEHPDMAKKPAILDFPYVIKAATGGEGRGVKLIHGQEDLNRTITALKQYELEGKFGFVMQEYLPGQQRDLRVVVIGEQITSYWRYQDSFLHNIAQGGKIDPDSDPHLQQKGQEVVRDLCTRTGINLAGFDLIFPEAAEEPLFLEINYTFGRRGLGGSEAFYTALTLAVQNLLQK